MGGISVVAELFTAFGSLPFAFSTATLHKECIHNTQIGPC